MKVITTKKRGNIGGKKVNSANINLYNISEEEGRTEIIETKEYFREISFDGSQLSWDYAHVKALGHRIRGFKIGAMGTTDKRKNIEKYVQLVDGTKVYLRQATHIDMPACVVKVTKAADFDDNIKALFLHGNAIIHLKDELVITSLVTSKEGVKYHWERIGMGTGNNKNYKLALVQVDKVKVCNLLPEQRRKLLKAVGKLALDAACTINTVHSTASIVACGR